MDRTYGTSLTGGAGTLAINHTFRREEGLDDGQIGLTDSLIRHPRPGLHVRVLFTKAQLGRLKERERKFKAE